LIFAAASGTGSLYVSAYFFFPNNYVAATQGVSL